MGSVCLESNFLSEKLIRGNSLKMNWSAERDMYFFILKIWHPAVWNACTGVQSVTLLMWWCLHSGHFASKTGTATLTEASGLLNCAVVSAKSQYRVPYGKIWGARSGPAVPFPATKTSLQPQAEIDVQY